jgi:PadR family transcriptional regulator, regulatory protein PadR
VNDAADGMFVWQEGTLYPVLHRLEKDGLVLAKWQQAASGRERKYYHITSKGRAALKDDVKQWAAFHELVLRVATGGGHV